jgi:hypothetical protein
MAVKKREAAKKEVQEDLVEQIEASTGTETAEEVYAELAAKAAAPTEQDARIAELEAKLAAAERALQQSVPAAEPRTPLDPDDLSLDEPVLGRDAEITMRGDKNRPVKVHSYRELGVHPDDLDDNVKVNPETGQIVRSRFIKKTSGNLIEMP